MKNLLKQFLVPALASRPVSALAGRIVGNSIAIFMLHRFTAEGESGTGHTPDYLRRCLTYLRDNGHGFVSLEDIIKHLEGKITLPSKSVAFTLDDGFTDQATLAVPVFREFDCPVSIFLVTGMVDGTLWPWFDQVTYLVQHANTSSINIESADGTRTFSLNSWHNRLNTTRSIQDIIKTLDPDSATEIIAHLAHSTRQTIPKKPPEGYRPITWDQARDLEQQGVIFGSHSVSHRILSKLNDRDLEDEITVSWSRIRDELTSPSRVFCYPNGKSADFGPREIEIVSNTGYTAAVSSIPSFVNPGSDSQYLYYLPRFALPKSFHDFMQYCSWIEQVKERLWG